MLYRFKIYGQRYVIDTKSMAFHKLSELEYDMLTYMQFPPEDAFPSSLRYDLAKYESSKLAEAYRGFAKLWADGVLNSDTPLTVEDEPIAVTESDATVGFDGTKFVFANEVIKAADSGCKVINALADPEKPVKASDFDIVALEYERIAKEIIKRTTGRVPFPTFDFVPFMLPVTVDEKGYSHIAFSACREILESDDEIGKKLIECAVAVL